MAGNELQIDLWVGTSPQSHAITSLLATVLINEWNNSNDMTQKNMYITMPGKEGEDRRTLQLSSNEEEDWRGNRRGYILFELGGNTSSTEDEDRAYILSYIQSVSELKAKYENRWWWHFNITFQWSANWAVVDNDATTGVAVGETTTDTPDMGVVEQDIHNTLTNSLLVFRDKVRYKLQNMTEDPNIRINTGQEGMPTPEEDSTDVPTIKDVQTPTPPPNGGGNDVDRLDPREWDLRKYVGLVLLVTTLAFTIILRVIAVHRLRERERQETWGNLATKEGVEALLNTAWVLDGSKLQIYDKTKMGYSDDDSLFLGGYEQREAVAVGAEITVTYPMTTTTATTTDPTAQTEFPGTSPSFLSSSNQSQRPG